MHPLSVALQEVLVQDKLHHQLGGSVIHALVHTAAKVRKVNFVSSLLPIFECLFRLHFSDLLYVLVNQSRRYFQKKKKMAWKFCLQGFVCLWHSINNISYYAAIADCEPGQHPSPHSFLAFTRQHSACCLQKIL